MYYPYDPIVLSIVLLIPIVLSIVLLISIVSSIVPLIPIVLSIVPLIPIVLSTVPLIPMVLSIVPMIPIVLSIVNLFLQNLEFLNSFKPNLLFPENFSQTKSIKCDTPSLFYSFFHDKCYFFLISGVKKERPIRHTINKNRRRHRKGKESLRVKGENGEESRSMMENNYPSLEHRV